MCDYSLDLVASRPAKVGDELVTTKFIPGRSPYTENPSPNDLNKTWGDGYGNRCDRFLACIAYLDGVRPR